MATIDELKGTIDEQSGTIDQLGKSESQTDWRQILASEVTNLENIVAPAVEREIDQKVAVRTKDSFQQLALRIRSLRQEVSEIKTQIGNQAIILEKLEEKLIGIVTELNSSVGSQD